MSSAAKVMIVLLALGAVSVPISYFLLPVVTFVVNAPSCSEDSVAVRYARSLSADRLAQLYRQMKAFSVDPDTPLRGYGFGDDASLPDAFSDLDVRAVRPRQGRVFVEHCMDHHVYLEIGVFDGSAENHIVLHWGERDSGQGSEVLWVQP